MGCQLVYVVIFRCCCGVVLDVGWFMVGGWNIGDCCFCFDYFVMVQQVIKIGLFFLFGYSVVKYVIQKGVLVSVGDFDLVEVVNFVQIDMILNVVYFVCDDIEGFVEMKFKCWVKIW